MTIQISLYLLLVTIGNRNVFFAENNASPVNHLYFAFLHYEWAMYTYKMLWRKLFFHSLHADKWQDGFGFVFYMYFYVIFQSFDV